MALSAEKVKAAITKNGSREVAIKILDLAVSRISGGLSMHDLPDTATVANGIDGIEDALNGEDCNGAWNIAQETAEEMLADEGFPMDSTISEKAKSLNQQQFMGMVRNCQKTGDCASKEVADTAKSMKKKDVKDFASTKHNKLPEKKKKKSKKSLKENNMDNVKKLAVDFINNICDKQYSDARKSLAGMVNEKVKQRIKTSAVEQAKN